MVYRVMNCLPKKKKNWRLNVVQFDSHVYKENSYNAFFFVLHSFCGSVVVLSMAHLTVLTNKHELFIFTKIGNLYV